MSEGAVDRCKCKILSVRAFVKTSPPLHGSVPPLIPPPHLLSHTRHCHTQSPPHTRMVLEQRGSSRTKKEASDTATSDGPSSSSAVPPLTSTAVPPAVPPPWALHWVLLALCRGPPVTANRGRAAAAVTVSPPSPPSEPPPPSVLTAGGEDPQGRCSLQGPLLRPTGGTSPAAAHTSTRG